MLQGRNKKVGNKPKIDDVDVRILKTLLKEPRTTFAEIAKDCDLSITSIRNRFNLMKKSGIINGAIMQINPKSFGYDCIALVNIEADHKDKIKVHDFLKNQHIAIYSPHVTGRNSILGFAVARNTDEMSQIVNQIKSHPKIRFVSAEIWIDMTNMDHPENLIIQTSDELSSTNEVPPKKKSPKDAFTANQAHINQNTNAKTFRESVELDKIDTSLIKILSNNARISFRRIAKNLSISPNNVIKRYKELRKNVFPFSSITVNLKKLGYMGTGIMAIKVSTKHSVKETFDKILRVPNVIVVIKLFGYYDILAIAPFRTFEDLDNLTEKISNMLGVYELNLKVDKPYSKWPLNMISDLMIENI